MLKPGIYLATLLFAAVAIPELAFAIIYLLTADAAECGNYYLMLICAIATLVHPAMVMARSWLGTDAEQVMDYIRGLLTAELTICGLYIFMVIRNDQCSQDWNELVYGTGILYAVIYMCNVVAVITHKHDTGAEALLHYRTFSTGQDSV
jgi:hypothetical protein